MSASSVAVGVRDSMSVGKGPIANPASSSVGEGSSPRSEMIVKSGNDIDMDTSD